MRLNLAIGLIVVALMVGVLIGQLTEQWVQSARHVLIIAPSGIEGHGVVLEASSGETWFMGMSPANCQLSAVKMQAGGAR